ncbi:hypothetical protein EKO04_011224 [Ascochyta lentis]|uniref:Peptidase A1 domain-containing protein n=1 Tax=Ascochyta lentis TaxID=205686 RepID=A0A8H7ITY3_9PLEO|nr:hypothetical protein EKO04_011224 [Ascochyta lentis]
MAGAFAQELSQPLFLKVPLIRNTGLSAYLAKMDVGTPPQEQYVKIDTGSPTYSFLDPRNPFCTTDNNPCSSASTFDNLTSSTSKYRGPGFYDMLIDHGFGPYLQDQVSIGGKLIPDAYFGYLDTYPFSSNVQLPVTTIAGMSLLYGNSSNYTSSGAWLLPQLKDANLIDKLVVSFYLGEDSRNGSHAQMILGAAYDKAKIEGTPFTVPMVDPYVAGANDQTNSVYITKLQSVIGGNVTNASFGNSSIGKPVLMDTGSPFWPIPEPIFDQVYRKLGQPTERDRTDGHYIFDCEVRKTLNDTEDYVTVYFGEAGEIKVPLSRLVTDFGNGSCGAFVTNGGDDLERAFGDPFLRSTYITLDQEELTVTFGQVKYTNQEDIVALPIRG